MSDHDDHQAEGHRNDGANPPTKNALRAGFAYLIVLGVVLTGLAAWFVLTRTAHPGG